MTGGQAQTRRKQPARARPLGGGLRFLGYVAKRFAGDKCTERAAALTYTSLLAMVPLLAVSFAIFAAFPAFEGMKSEVQSYVFQNFVPEIGSSIQEHVEQFTSKAGQLTGIGVVFLGVTSIMLLSTISNTFNAIWRVHETRAVVARLLAYWAALTLTPLLFGASLSLSSYLFAIAQSSGVTAQIGIANAAAFLPLFMQIIGFTILFIVIPYFPVRPRDALMGGITAGLLFELLKKGFGLYISHFPTYQTIYGALAMVPIFLIWVYVAWLVVLFGAVLTASVPEWRAGVRETRHGNIRPARKLIAGLSILAALLAKAQQGGALRARDLLRVSVTAPDAVMEAASILTKEKYISKGEGGTWLLCRDLDTATLADLHAAFGLAVETHDFLNMERVEWSSRIIERMTELNESGTGIMSVSLRELLKEVEGAEIIEFPDGDDEEEVMDRKSKWLSILGLAWIGSS